MDVRSDRENELVMCFLSSVFSCHLLMCVQSMCSNAEIPVSSASSEDRSFRADIAASFQVIIQ